MLVSGVTFKRKKAGIFWLVIAFQQHANAEVQRPSYYLRFITLPKAEKIFRL